MAFPTAEKKFVTFSGVAIAVMAGGYIVTNPTVAVSGCPTVSTGTFECRVQADCFTGYICSTEYNGQLTWLTNGVSPVFGHCYDPNNTCDASPAIQADLDALGALASTENYTMGREYNLPTGAIFKLNTAAAQAGTTVNATGCSMTLGSAVLNCTSSPFASIDYFRPITVTGAGSAGGNLSARIIGMDGPPNAGKQVTLDTAALTGVSGTTATYTKFRVALHTTHRVIFDAHGSVLQCNSSNIDVCMLLDVPQIPTAPTEENADYSMLRNLSLRPVSFASNSTWGIYVGAPSFRFLNVRSVNFGRPWFINGTTNVYDARRWRGFAINGSGGYGYNWVSTGNMGGGLLAGFDNTQGAGSRMDDTGGSTYLAFGSESNDRVSNDPLSVPAAVHSIQTNADAGTTYLGSYMELDEVPIESVDPTLTTWLGGSALAEAFMAWNYQRVGYSRSHLVFADKHPGYIVEIPGKSNDPLIDYAMRFIDTSSSHGGSAEVYSWYLQRLAPDGDWGIRWENQATPQFWNWSQTPGQFFINGTQLIVP